jgi:hypothetical protein
MPGDRNAGRVGDDGGDNELNDADDGKFDAVAKLAPIGAALLVLPAAADGAGVFVGGVAPVKEVPAKLTVDSACLDGAAVEVALGSVTGSTDDTA